MVTLLPGLLNQVRLTRVHGNAVPIPELCQARRRRRSLKIFRFSIFRVTQQHLNPDSCARKMPLPKLVLLNAWFQTQAVFGAGPVSLVGDKAK
jgi:hypothetical protein